jgi:CRP-like cAMP-binding protein
VSAKILQDDTTVLVLSHKAIEQTLADSPNMPKLIKSIMSRLQRVSIVALSSLANSVQIFQNCSGDESLGAMNHDLGVGLDELTIMSSMVTIVKEMWKTGSFKGCEVIEWLLNQVKGMDRQRARKFANQLLKEGLLICSSGNKITINNTSSYTFCEENFIIQCEQNEVIKTTSFTDALGLTPEQVQNLNPDWTSSISVMTYQKDETILHEGSASNCGLKVVVMGKVTLSKVSTLQEVLPGGVINSMQVLSNEPCFFTATAAQDNTQVATMCSEFVELCIVSYPQVSINLAVNTIKFVSDFLRCIDFALDRQQIDSGHVLYEQGDEASYAILVLNGRLRSVSNVGTINNYQDSGRGDIIGLKESFDQKRERNSTVWAGRDSEVARIPYGVIDLILQKHPYEMIALFKKFLSEEKNLQSEDQEQKFSTVAVLPLSKLPTTIFCHELNRSLNIIDRATVLNSRSVENDLGPSPEDYHLNDYLASKEDCMRVTIFQCDQGLTDWTKICLRHADVILLLANPNDPKEVGALEAEVQRLFPRIRKELVFLHPSGTKFPSGAAMWLGERGHFAEHFHVQLQENMTGGDNENYIASSSKPSVHSDFSRMARHLTNTE